MMSGTISNDISAQLTASAYVMAIKQMTGANAKAIDKGDHLLIVVSDRDVPIVHAFIEKFIAPQKPGKVRFEALKLFGAPVFKVYGKLAIGLILLAYFAGKMSR